MRASSQKDLAVYDFNEEEEAVEAASGKYTAKLRSRLSSKMEDGAFTKYTFLQAFAPGSGRKETDITGVLCVDLHEKDSIPSSYAINSLEANLDEFECGNLTSKVRSVMEASTVSIPSAAREQYLHYHAKAIEVHMGSDGEESLTSESDSSSSTDHEVSENEGYLEPASLDDCISSGETFENNVAVVLHPDIVKCSAECYLDPLLTFLSDRIKIECSDTSTNDEETAIEWKISDVVHIDSHWSESVTTACVRLHLRANEGNDSTNAHFVKVEIILTDSHWLEKEQKIRNLASRYHEIWHIGSHDDLVRESDTIEHNLFLGSQYLNRVMEPFEDIIYPKGDPDAVSINKRDVDLLLPETFINDTIIDFYIKYLCNKMQPDEKKRFHFFNSFFFRKLADLDKDQGKASEGRAAFLRVHKWTRKVNIFEKDYIFIPVNFNLHWSLLVICHPGEITASGDDNIKKSLKVPCILHMDSLKGSHSGLKNIVQSYLWEEWKERHSEAHADESIKFLSLRFVALELPQQENSFDCGLFLLHYVELFIEDAPTSFSPFKINMFSSFLTADWFPPADASLKRSLIWKLVYELVSEPSHKDGPGDCCNGHRSSDCAENGDAEQGPVVEFPADNYCLDNANVDSVCAVFGRGTETKQLAIPSSIDECAKKPVVVRQDILETGATAGPHLESQEHLNQQVSPCQKLSFAISNTEGQIDIDESLAAQQPGGSPESQILISCTPTNAGACEKADYSMQEILEDSSPGPLAASHMACSHKDGLGEHATVFTDHCRIVLESPTTSSGVRINICDVATPSSNAGNASVQGCMVSRGVEAIRVNDADDQDASHTRPPTDDLARSGSWKTSISAEGENLYFGDCMPQCSRRQDRGDAQYHQDGGNTVAKIGEVACWKNLCKDERLLSDDTSQEKDLKTSDDESSLEKDDVQAAGTKPVKRRQKRRKLVFPEGTRRLTRSSMKSSSS